MKSVVYGELPDSITNDEKQGPDRPYDCHQEQPCRRNCLKLRLREGTVEEVNCLILLEIFLDACIERCIKSYWNPCDRNTTPTLNKSPHRTFSSLGIETDSKLSC